MTTDDIDKELESLCDHIIQGANNNIPKKTYKLIPVLTQSTKTKNLLQIYNNRYNIYKHNLSPQRIQILNNIKQHINSSAAEDTCSYSSMKMDQLEEFKAARDPKNFFRTIQNLKGKNNYNLGTYLIHNNTQIYDHKEQADLLAQTWENIMHPNKPRNSNEITENVQKVKDWNSANQNLINPLQKVNLNNLSNKNQLTKQITLTETAHFLNKIKSQATGPMPISKTILKHTPLKTGLHITRLYNAILSTGYFPKILKQAEIFLIIKPDKDPTLNLYTNDTPTLINEKITILLYADDITILTYHKDRWALRRDITNELKNIDNFHSKWLINTNKNKSIVFLYNQTIGQAAGQPVIRVNGDMIPYKDHTKILGTIFDNKMKFNKHLDHRIKIAKATKAKLTRFRTLNSNYNYIYLIL